MGGIKSLLGERLAIVWQPQSLSKNSFNAWTYIKADRMVFKNYHRLDKETEVCSLSIDRSAYCERLFLYGFLHESNATSMGGKKQYQER